MGDSLKKIETGESRKKVGDTFLPKLEKKNNKHAQRVKNLKDAREKQKNKKNNRKIRAAEGLAKLTPKTIESTREQDATLLTGGLEEICDLKTDEFSEYFNKDYEPRILITFSEKPIKASRKFALQLCKVIPNCMQIGRKNKSIKSIVKEANEKKFTDIILLNEDGFKTNGLLLIHLPEGPTAYFRLSNIKTCTKKQMKEITAHRPEVILNNFNTRLGQTVGRMLGAVFHYQPEFKGRKVITFHNQRDYIFFRHHRYKFLRGQPCLRELGPRFTLKLESVQRGTFDSKCGDYEWNIFGRRHELETSRRKFFL